MKNTLTLHEAIVQVLSKMPNRTGTTKEIVDQINKAKLYLRKDKTPVPPYQIMMRTKLGKGRYHHLFEFIDPDIVKLK